MHVYNSTIQAICSYSWTGRPRNVSDPGKISYPHATVLAKHTPGLILMGWMMKQSTPKQWSEWERLHDSNPGCTPTTQTSHTPEHSCTACCLWVMKTFLLYARLLGLLTQQSSERWAQFLFLLTIKIINRPKFFLQLPLYKPTKARDAFSFSGIKKGRSKSKAPNWSLPYLSDRWIVHCPFTVSHASQCVPCGILCPRL